MIITKSEFINVLNNYAFDGNPKEIINIMNLLIDNGSYKKCLDLIFIAISSTQLYGFLSYLSEEEKMIFFECDYYRSYSYRGNNIDFYNKGQLSFLLELEKNQKVFFSAPTSFGKTGIIVEYILNNYKSLNNVVFIVPTNSLIEELFCKFLDYNIDLEMNYNITTQPKLSRNRNLLFLTPERFSIIAEENKLEKFDLIIMDETYKIVDSRDEKISDFVNSRAVRFRKTADMIGEANTKVVFLSPFTYSLTESMKKFLEKYNIFKIDRRLEYVKREIEIINNAKTVKKYFQNEKFVGYTQNAKISIKSKILLNEMKNSKNIVYVANYAKAYDICDEITFSCKTDKEKQRFEAFLIHLKQNYFLEGEPGWKVIDALDKGIGIYISPLARYIKRELINLYDKNAINTLIVTTAFTEGVNTSASNLIFTSLINGPTTNKLSDIDILNVAGRVGRFSSKTVGRVFCLSQEIYDRILSLQNNQDYKLENYNYCKLENRIDFEIEMIDNDYLTEAEKLRKSEINREIEKLGLSHSDLFISLNVSNVWKICLYKHFSELNFDDLKVINKHIESIYLLEEGTRIEALDYIFKDLSRAFKKSEISGFPHEKYDISPFDSSDEFIWGRLYKVYLAGSIKNVIAKNKNFISKKFSSVNNSSKFTKKSDVEELFDDKKLKWVLSYYDSNLKLNINKVYSETFKFISNIVQYKIPFYLSFYVSIFKLFITKSSHNFSSTKGFDIKELINIFEEGQYDDEYKELVDYGLPITLLEKLSKNNINLKSISEKNYNRALLDEYENIMIDDINKYI